MVGEVRMFLSDVKCPKLSNVIFCPNGLNEIEYLHSSFEVF